MCMHMCMYVCVHGCERIVCVYVYLIAIMHRVGGGEIKMTHLSFFVSNLKSKWATYMQFYVIIIVTVILLPVKNWGSRSMMNMVKGFVFAQIKPGILWILGLYCETMVNISTLIQRKNYCRY